MFRTNLFSVKALLRASCAVALLCLASASQTVSAQQHDHHQHTPPPQTKPTPTPTPPTQTQTATPPAQNTPPAQTAPPVQSPAPAQSAPHAAHDQHRHDAAPAQSAPVEATPAATPAATPTVNAVAPDHSAHGVGTGERTATAAPRFDGSLFVMTDDGDMGIRVGASEKNVIPMGQMGSGTAWQPATTPSYMWHEQAGDWLLMFHGDVKLGVNRQGGPRGITKFESQNWFMPMALRRVGRGTLQLRGMFSFEPFTFSGAGSPQLFQTGEVYKGQPIIDAQHPHDLIMELSAQYTLPVGERSTWYAYVGYPGEPALGPVAFMHRASASENPTAPLAHHLQDSTHIAFGVFTTGFTYRWLKVEGSVFNGREPDEHRYGFEANPWNSRSARISVAPNRNWTLQYSYGFLKSPELLHEGDTHRQTASVQYNRPFARGNWATTLVWGRNRERHDDETFRLNGYTAESTVNFLDRNYLYTRLELVDRNNLLTHEETHELGFGEDSHPQFRIGAYTFGGARDVWNTDKISVALGADVTLYSKPEILDTLYGRTPVSTKFFVRIRPRRMDMSGHGAHTTTTTTGAGHDKH